MSKVSGSKTREQALPSPRGISVVILRPIIECLGRTRGGGTRMSEALGIASAAPADLFVPGTRVNAVLGHATAGAIPLALEVLAAAPIGALGLFDYLMAASKNLEEALDGFRRLYGLLTQVVTLRVDRDRGTVRIGHDAHVGATRVPFMSELAFAALHDRTRRAIGDDWPLRAVRFTHSVPPEAERAFRVHFGCDVAFEASRDEMTVDARALSVPFPTADPVTASFLRERAERFRVALPNDDDLADVRAAISHARGGRRPMKLSEVARSLGTSSRSLQRRLHLRDTKLRDLIAAAQRELALRLIENPMLSLGEIAYELGFADHASFHRAFVRWTGETPGDHRASLIGGTATSRP